MRLIGVTLAVVCLAAGGASAASAQASKTPARQDRRSDAAIVANAISAAPEEIGRHATVAVSDGMGMMRTIRKGTNGFTCMPDNPAAPRSAPMCFDGGAMAWVQAFKAKQPPPAGSPIGITYMLRGSWTPSNDDPRARPVPGAPGVATGPALMIVNTHGMLAGYPRNASNPGQPFVMWGGTPYEHLMVPVASR